MRKVQILYVVIVLFATVTLNAQEYYVAFSTGLNIRKTPSLQAEILGKIPYATKVKTDIYKKDTVKVMVDGMTGYWTPVNYQGKNGYVLDAYLISIPPPKAGTKTMGDYLLQLSPKFGNKMEFKSNTTAKSISESGYVLTKQLYKNGIEWNGYTSWEYHSNTYFFPISQGIKVSDMFLIIRQINEFQHIFSEKDAFPTENKKIKKKPKYSTTEEDFDIKVEVESFGGTEKIIMKLHVDYIDGSNNTLEIFLLDGQMVVSESSGV
jgi:uncharacterized protein YgiM (DUF1202 family)